MEICNKYEEFNQVHNCIIVIPEGLKLGDFCPPSSLESDCVFTDNLDEGIVSMLIFYNLFFSEK